MSEPGKGYLHMLIGTEREPMLAEVEAAHAALDTAVQAVEATQPELAAALRALRNQNERHFYRLEEAEETFMALVLEFATRANMDLPRPTYGEDIRALIDDMRLKLFGGPALREATR